MMQYFMGKTAGKAIALGMIAAMLVSAMPATMVAADETPAADVPAIVFSQDTEDDGTLNPGKTPRQINAHMGEDPSTQINITYATTMDAKTQVVVNAVGDDETITVSGESSQQFQDPANPENGYLNQGKFIHKITVSDLEPDTEYEYTVGYGANTYSGKFQTMLPAGSKDSFRYVYVADTQVANGDDDKALGATQNRINELDPDFVYISGDITDTAANEAQWERLFNNRGAFPNGGQDMFGNNTLLVTQGNHDNNILNRHINAPAEMGNIVSSFDNGPATFVILNLEAARSSNTARDDQAAYLRSVVEDAKARGQWTIVGFHKSLYTGASHITDSDVIAARSFWGPLFAELKVDLVMQGHDHVYSRGFVNADGTKADVETTGENSYIDPDAPLYMVGGHAGGLKWYSKKAYNVSDGDPLIPGYAFLDVNSTNDQSDIKQEQWIVEVEVTNEALNITTSAFKYDTDIDQITTEPYVYDQFSVSRDAAAGEEGLNITTDANLETGSADDYFRVNTALSAPAKSNVATVKYTYDTERFDYRGFTAADGVTELNNTAIEGGRVITLMIADYNAQSFGEVLFSGKEGGKLSNGNSTIGVTVDYVVKADSGSKSIVQATGSVSFTTGGNQNGGGIGDYDGDGIISLLDLSNVIDLFGTESGDPNWNNAQFFDVNGNGTLDIYDISSIAKKIQ